MISTNIKIARTSKGLSLQELSEKLTKSGHYTTKATLSNYENGKFIPSDDFIKHLARELSTSYEFFYKEVETDFSINYFTKPDLVDRKEQYLNAFVNIELDRFLYIDNILGIKTLWKKPERTFIPLEDIQKVDEIAEQFRKDYGAGSGPISSVCNLLEAKGWHIFSLPEYCPQDAKISGYEENTGSPFILYRPDGYQDEMRLNLLKNVGYSLMYGNTPEETDLLVERFSRAVLFTEKLAKFSFGNQRTKITEYELSNYKKMYGIGKKYIMCRLCELGIISKELYNEYMTYIGQRFDLVRSSGLLDDSMFYEVPTSYEMRVARANAEGLTKIVSSKTSYSLQ